MTLTFNELLGIVVALIGLIALFVLFWHRPQLVDTKEQAKEQQIHVDFDARRDAEAERNRNLTKEQVRDEANHPRR